MLKSECDKLYKGRCSCLGRKIYTAPTETHWCETRTTEVVVIDTYYLPKDKSIFFGNPEHEITKISKEFMELLKDKKKVQFTAHIQKLVAQQGIYEYLRTHTMKWREESDFLPAWVWMIESGYNKERDLHNEQHGIKFIKQVITKTRRFTIHNGPYTTHTTYPPYHVDFNAGTV